MPTFVDSIALGSVDQPSAPDPALSPEVKRRRANSFGQAASQYERYRPGPPADAVDWLLPQGADTVVDLGAGTGALTRLLVDRADQVIAVEPDERMRAVLADEVVRATVLEGRGESLPVDDGIADAVLASSSWHWVEPGPALREVARVLKPGGFLGAIWAGPDQESPFMVQAQALLGEIGRGEPTAGPASETIDAISTESYRSMATLQIPDGLPFSDPIHMVFRRELALTADDLIGLLGTLSWVILKEPEEREALFSTARRLLRDALGVEGDTTVDLTFRCDTYRSDLLA
jgi:SAM-dependent methyltransferase